MNRATTNSEPKMVTMGKQTMEMGGPYLGWMKDSSDLMGNPAGLRERMAEDGYLLLRGLHNPDTVLRVQNLMCSNLAENDQLIPGSNPADCRVREGAHGAFLGGSKALTRSNEFLSMVESPELMAFFADYFESSVITYDYKWLRVVGPGEFTGAHYDVVYMGRGTRNLLTCWSPITSVSLDRGPLAVLSGSNHLQQLRENYGEMDVDRDHVTGSFSNDPLEMIRLFGGRWLTSEFEPGDAVIFGMYNMHGSLDNASSQFRISCDCRYQRATETVDERWMGENPPAHYAWMKGETVTMEAARKRWGV